MSMRVDKAEYRRAPTPVHRGQLRAGAASRPPAASFGDPGARNLLAGPAAGSLLARGLTPPEPALPRRPEPPRVDTNTIGGILHALVEQYERPVSFEELVLAGLRHMVRDDGRLTLHVDAGALVIRDGGAEIARQRLPDTAALSARENAETRDGTERGNTPGYLLTPAWGGAVRDAIAAIHEARPQLVPQEQLTARFFAFLPEYLDVYTGYTGGSGGSGPRFGISYSLHGGQPTVSIVARNSPAAAAGLRAGDRLLAIGGDNVRGASMRRVGEVFASHPEGPVAFTVERDGRELTLSIARALFDAGPSVTGYVRRGVAVIRVRELELDTAEAVRLRLRELRAEHPQLAGVILDLRSNGGGHVSAGVDVADNFLDSGRITEQRYGRTTGADTAHDATPGDIAAGLPMVVLVNGASYSAAELTALALGENGRATLMGTRTGGKGSMQAYPFFLPVRITVGRYHGPRGTTPHEVGVPAQICTGPGADPCAPSYLLRESDVDTAIDHILARP